LSRLQKALTAELAGFAELSLFYDLPRAGKLLTAELAELKTLTKPRKISLINDESVKKLSVPGALCGKKPFCSGVIFAK